MGKYDFVMGLDPRREDDAEAKMRQEADMMRSRVERRGQGAVDEYEAVPMVGDEDSPEQHREYMDVGRKLAGEFEAPPPAPGGGDWSGIESIGRAAQDIGRRASAPRASAPRAEGLQGIQDTALDILARAQSRGGRR